MATKKNPKHETKTSHDYGGGCMRLIAASESLSAQASIVVGIGQLPVRLKGGCRHACRFQVGWNQTALIALRVF